MKDRRTRTRPRSSARPTQRDIADAAGVSQATVSMVLNKVETPSVPQSTRQRILKLAGEVGYQPNHPARNLRSAKTMTLACVIPDITNPFYPGLVRGLQRTAAPADYDVLIYDTDGVPEGERRAIEWLLQGRADGVVATFFHMRVPDLAALSRHGIPLVRLESQNKSKGDLPIDSVYIDNAGAAAAMTQFLIARGHRQISMIRGAFGPGERRALGYANVMREAGLTPDFMIADAYSEEAGANAMHRLLAKPRNRATAVFGASDVLALGAMEAARADGITVPSDIAIVGFDDIPAAKLLGLTTVRQPEFQLGTLAAKVLIERLKPGGMTPPGQSLELKFEIIARTSA
jgi:DNA-binding LacI/PurR family transcriptional regulator